MKASRDDFQPPLGTWVMARGIPQRRLAVAMNVDAATILRWCRGDNRPDIANALRITRLTNGSVGIEDWLTIAEIETLESIEPIRPRTL